MSKNNGTFMDSAMAAANTIENSIGTLAKGAPDAKNVNNKQNAKNVNNANNTPAKPGRKPKYETEKMERINMQIPKELKEHLTIQAAKATMQRKTPVSLTEYLCELIAADMQRNKGK